MNEVDIASLTANVTMLARMNGKGLRDPDSE